MTWQFSFPVFLLLLTAILGAILAVAAWRWHSRPGGRALFLLIVAASGWCLLAAMEHATVALPARLIVARFTYLGAASTAPLLLLFILTYTQQMHRLKAHWRTLLWLIPALTVILAFTNELHQWVWTQALPLPHSSGEPLAVLYTRGFWFWVAAAYNCLLMALSVATLVHSLWQRPNLYRPQAAGLIVAAILPWPAYGLYLAAIAPFASLDLTPIAFVLSSLSFAWAISMGRLLQLAPIARDLLVENMMDGVLVLDTQHQIIDANTRFTEIIQKLGLPLTRNELLGRRTDEVFAVWPEIIQRYYNASEIQDELRLDVGDKLALDLHISPLRDSSGRLIGRLFLAREITEKYQLQETLRLQSAALQAAANAVVITDLEGAIQWVNPAFTTITGYTKEEAIGQNPRLLKSDKHEPSFYKNLWETVLAGQVWRGELVNRRKDGSTYYEEQTITPVRNEQDKITHFIAIKQDVSTRKQAEESLRNINERLRTHIMQVEELQERLREQAIRDPLTGLFNRRYLDEMLNRELARSERQSAPISLVMLDLDHFKKINDTHGHQAGDIILRLLGDLLDDLVRAGDIVCRYGGEEFVVVMPGAPLEIATHRAEEWRLAFGLMSVQYQGATLQTTLSAGVATYPQHARSAEQLLRAADQALYQAKQTGRNRVVGWKAEQR